MIVIYVRYFDEPLLRGVALPVRRQSGVTIDGLRVVESILQGMGVKARFCVSTQMASDFAPLVERLRGLGHLVEVTDIRPHINYWRSLHVLSPVVVGWLDRGCDIVFNAWEFSSKVEYNKEFRLPFIVRRHCGRVLGQRLAMLLDNLKNRGYGV